MTTPKTSKSRSKACAARAGGFRAAWFEAFDAHGFEPHLSTTFAPGKLAVARTLKKPLRKPRRALTRIVKPISFFHRVCEGGLLLGWGGLGGGLELLNGRL